MLLNYIKLSFRLLLRNPNSTGINILGLSVGFSAFLMLWPYANNELKSDQYHHDSDRIVRVGVDFKWTDNGKTWNGFKAAFNNWGTASEIGKTFSRIECTTRLVTQLNYVDRRHGVDRDLFITVIDSSENKLVFRENQTIFADTNFFEFFTVPLVLGNADQVLDDPHTAVISQTISKKYFGEKVAIGKTIYLKDS